tara:strand:+ start:1077 stop:1436 length:360 start_codon:yes stop_codon:yes gene_type:complete
MSTLNVANITDGTDTVETGYVVNGSAKAWCKFVGTGTATINDSLNISSLDDNGTGQYDINYTNNFSNGNSSVVGMSNWAGVCTADSYNASYHLLKTRGGASTPLQDRGHITTATFGDLA